MLRKQRPELLSQCRPTSFSIFYFGFWPTIARRNPCNYMLVEIHPPLIKKKNPIRSYSSVSKYPLELSEGRGIFKEEISIDITKGTETFYVPKTSLNESAGNTIYDFKKVIFVCIRWIKLFGLVRAVNYWTHSLKTKKGPVSCIFPVLDRGGR